MAERKRRAGRQPHQSEILEHEVTLYKGLQFSPQEFYARVEKALKDRQIPDIVIERVDWPEGGVLSPKREYLRASREHVVFDICAAPFGTGFFISTWFDVRPPNLGLPAVLLFIAMLIAGADALTLSPYGLHHLMMKVFQVSRFGAALLVLIGFFVVIVHLIRTARLRQADVDAVFLRIPGVDWVYLNFLRRITFYRVDQHACFLADVRDVMAQVVAEVTDCKGIQPPSDSIKKPILKKMYWR